MTNRLHPRYMLLHQHCHLLRECRHILDREAPQGDLKRATEDSLAASEAIALRLLDEEYAHVLRVKDAVATSGSLPLIEKLAHLRRSPLSLNPGNWESVFANSGAGYVRALLNGPVNPSGASIPLLGRVQAGESGWNKLLQEVAAIDTGVEYYLGTASVLFEDGHHHFEKADFLRRQVEAFPLLLAAQARKVGQFDNLTALACLCLAGAKVPDPSDLVGPSRAFAILMGSNHGRMKILEQIGDLETVLAHPEVVLGKLLSADFNLLGALPD